MMDLSLRATRGLLFPVLAVLLACSTDGGANAGQHAPGDGAGGVALGLGDIAVAPVDDFVLFERADALAVGSTKTGDVKDLPVSDPTRLAFSKTRPVVFVGTTERSGEIVAIDMTTRARLWTAPFDGATTSRLRLAATADGRFVVASDVTTGLLRVLDASTGATRFTTELHARIVDLQLLPDDRRVVAVLSHSWTGGVARTPVVVVSVETSSRTTFDVPNCSDRLGISTDGKRGFLAPTTCQKDPISVLDLESGHEGFVRNLPGFGPVAVAPTGNLAVGFLDRTAVDRTLFDDPGKIPAPGSARYHLMLIDPTTLSYELVPVGDALPRFAVTPDGNVLLVDSSWYSEVPARLFDVTTKTWVGITGTPLVLDDFVLTSDSRHAYVIDAHASTGLYDLDLGAHESVEIPLPFPPTNINISPTDETLYLREDDDTVCVFSLASRRCRTTLSTRNVTPSR